MPYFALFYEAGDDFIARRAEYREEHLRLQLGIFRQTGVQLNHFVASIKSRLRAASTKSRSTACTPPPNPPPDKS